MKFQETFAFFGCLCLFGACTGGSPYGTKPSEAETKVEQAPPESAAAHSTDEIRKNGNHLKGEPSPYLEQHAHNPVDWYPWGDAALEKAKRENKPIFLSIGYSTCHWCHVMEEESFEDDEVAAFLNEHFVAIKVDREQRPDIDALYIDAVRALGGSTGWPLTVFLTPNLEPYFGGTYYPRHASRGRPGFMEILAQVQEMYATDGEAVAVKGQGVLKKIEQRALAAVRQPGRLEAALLDRAMSGLAGQRDMTDGGFGVRTKFPNAPLLLAQLRYVKRTGDAQTKEHLVLTLDAMSKGGIRDHLEGSFHRYSVDKRWHLPHFEKTLYDNAQLASLYIEAGLFFERDDFVLTGRLVLDHMMGWWKGEGDGYIVGYDADDPGGEGYYYSWTPDELNRIIGEKDAKIFAAAFGVTAQGDREIGGRSVLHRKDDAATAKALGITEEELHAKIRGAITRLVPMRRKRKPPARDEKVLVGWNGLAIMAFADAGRWLREAKYTRAATQAATFVLEQCWKDGAMQRGVRGKRPLGPGFLEDYALAGLGMVRLHAATGELKWLHAARDIADAIKEHYYDEKKVAFMRTRADDQGLPVRLADMDDGVLPSGGTAAMLLALELGALSGDEALYEMGEKVLNRSAGFAENNPRSAGFLLVAIDHALGPVREVVIAGDPENELTKNLRSELTSTTHARILPTIIPATGLEGDRYPALEGKRALKDKPTAFVCERGSCQAPTSDPAKLRKQLEAVRP